jgi:F-type H+-transporting ATPase subunit delta
MADSSSKNKASAAHVDIGQQQLALVYARALLGAAEEAGVMDAVAEELASLVSDVLDVSPQFEELLASRLIDHDERIGILDRTLGTQASPLVLNFLKVVSRHERLDCLRAICRVTQSLYDEKKGRIAVRVSTATPIDESLVSQLTVALRDMLGGDPRLELVTEPDLIGGVVLRVGDTVYDGSVATQLQSTRRQMISRSIHEIQSGRDRFSSSEGN